MPCPTATDSRHFIVFSPGLVGCSNRTHRFHSAQTAMPFAQLRNPVVRRVSINVAALGVERLARLVVALLVTAAVGRHLGVDQFGLYNAIFSLCTLFAVSSDLGISRVVVRDLVSGHDNPGTLLGTAIAMRLGSSLILCGVTVAAVAISYRSQGSEPLILGMLFGMGYVFRASDAIDLGFQAVTQGQVPALARMISLGIGAGIQLWLIRRGSGMQAFAWAFAIEGFLMALSLAWVWWRFGPPEFRRWRFEFGTGFRVLRESWPMFVAFLYTQVYYRLDTILLEKMRGGTEAGIYSASAKFYDILIGVMPLIGVSLFPTLARWYKDDREGFSRLYTQLTRWITWLGLFGVVVLYLLRDQVVDLIFGQEYAEAARVLPWHLASAAIMFNAIFRAAYLTLAHRQIILLWTSLIGAVVNVGLNLLLIPRLGAEGSAMAGFVTQLVALHLTNGLFKETRWLFRVSLQTFLPFGTPARCS